MRPWQWSGVSWGELGERWKGRGGGGSVKCGPVPSVCSTHDTCHIMGPPCPSKQMDIFKNVRRKGLWAGKPVLGALGQHWGPHGAHAPWGTTGGGEPRVPPAGHPSVFLLRSSISPQSPCDGPNSGTIFFSSSLRTSKESPSSGTETIVHLQMGSASGTMGPPGGWGRLRNVPSRVPPLQGEHRPSRLSLPKPRDSPSACPFPGDDQRHKTPCGLSGAHPPEKGQVPRPENSKGPPRQGEARRPPPLVSSEGKQTPCGKPHGLFQEASVCPQDRICPPPTLRKHFPRRLVVSARPQLGIA